MRLANGINMLASQLPIVVFLVLYLKQVHDHSILNPSLQLHPVPEQIKIELMALIILC